MTTELTIQRMRRDETDEAAAMSARSFQQYEYFTLCFPEGNERARFLLEVLRLEFRTNFSHSHFLLARRAGRNVAVVHLNPPECRRPGNVRYIFNGGLKLFRTARPRRVHGWLAMDAKATESCHEYQMMLPGVWYMSLFAVDPAFQGCGIGSLFLIHIEDYVKSLGGREIVLLTNSEKNYRFYSKRGYKVFDAHPIHYGENTMLSWSLRKRLP